MTPLQKQQPSLALITTTINLPSVLALYARLGPDVRMFVTGDLKTPHDAVRELCRTLPAATYYDVEAQGRLGYLSSEVIGWNSIQRRNIALLEAIRSGADVIVTIDDDNIPVDPGYFDDIARLFAQGFSGLAADAEQGWFDVGRMLTPAVCHRGFPYDRRRRDLGVTFSAAVDAKVGVAAGLWLGDPDVDAMERITNAPQVHQLSEVLRAGVAVRPGCMTPFNSQNTAFVRELAPAMMVWRGIGRYDDIWAAYIAGRIMRETGHFVHFGKPLVWQERNKQSLFGNLEDEIFGMKQTPRFVADLDAIDIGNGSVIDRLRRIVSYLGTRDYMPKVAVDQGLAWCEDVERVLG